MSIRAIQGFEPSKINVEQLEKLLWDEIGDLLHVENMLLKALPKLAAGTWSPELKNLFEKHFVQTQGQAKRLEKMFATAELPAREKKSEAMLGLLVECQHLLTRSKPSLVTDQALICAAEKIESFEVVSYRALARWADLCGQEKIKLWAAETEAEEQAMLIALAECIEVSEPQPTRRQK